MRSKLEPHYNDLDYGKWPKIMNTLFYTSLA